MDFEINAEKREEYGKNVSRRIRREGKVPAVLYGAKTQTQPVTLEKADCHPQVRFGRKYPF